MAEKMQPMALSMDHVGDDILAQGEFDVDATAKFHTCNAAAICCYSIVFIPFMPGAFCCIPNFKREAREREVRVTKQNLHYSSNSYCFIPPFCFDPCLIKCNTITKTVPLEKITDLTYSQGLFQRWCGVDQLAVQTASSGGVQAEVSLIGLKDSKNFRKKVFDIKHETQGESSNAAGVRQAVSAGMGNAPPYSSVDPGQAMAAANETLSRIASSVQHIENMVQSIEAKAQRYEKLKENQ